MNSKGKIYVILTALALVLIVVLEMNKPEELNWFPSYAKHHKIPFGTFVFHEQLERLFSKENIVDVNQPPFEYLTKNDFLGTYVFVNNNVTIDDAELKKLLDWTTKGNTLVIASQTISENLLDTLNLKQSLVSNFDNINNIFELQLKHDRLKTDSTYTFSKTNYMNYFESTKDSTAVISVVNGASKETFNINNSYTNSIKQAFGEGEIILSTFPQAFTNYFILKNDNSKFTAGLLSYLDPSKKIYLDNHYKSGKKISTSPLYVFFKAKQLKWAYYIALIGVLFYIFFEGKRKQRSVPVINPLQNQTLAFTRTIANMYYESGNHAAIANHKIEHFLEFIRTHLYLSTSTINAEFLKNLAARSNNTIENTTSLFETIKTVSTSQNINKEALETLNTSIEKFKANTSWKSKM